MHRGTAWLLLFALAGLVLAVLGLAVGSVQVPLPEVWRALCGLPGGTNAVIVLQVRLPEVLTAMAAGAGLGAAGLMMQTVFHNPLAGPGVLGISSGASMGVALVMLARPLWPALPVAQDLLVMAAALAGALAVLLLITLADRRIGDSATLLILGLMVGYLASALVSVLQAASEAGALKGFVLWGMGSFAAVDARRLPWLWLPVAAGLVLAVSLAKPLNALLIGDENARSMGVDVRRVHRTVIWATGMLAGTITACCGPVAFLGLAVPHLARACMRSVDHRLLMPGTILLGAALALACDLVVRLPWSGGAVPLNTVTSLLGAPVVLWILLKGRRWGRG